MRDLIGWFGNISQSQKPFQLTMSSAVVLRYLVDKFITTLDKSQLCIRICDSAFAFRVIKKIEVISGKKRSIISTGVVTHFQQKKRSTSGKSAYVGSTEIS